MAKRERVAFLGLGIMGAPMAANLARAGFELTVWNRTRTRAETFSEDTGAHVAHTPRDAAAAADVVITMVPDGPDVESVLFGDRGAGEGLRQGGLVIDMSTIAPSTSVSIGERLGADRVAFLDAPVSGSRPKAEDGTLTIMAGGTPEAFGRARPVLDAMGQLVVHVGPQGHGSLTKLINNTLAAANAAALAEALALARAGHLDTTALLRVVGASSGASTMAQLKAGPMLDGNYEALFKLEHMLKDVRHFLAEARRLESPTDVASSVERLYAQAERQGLGESDFAAVMAVVEDAAAEKNT